MSAIITNKFRLDATQNFESSIKTGTDKYYIGLGRSTPWLDGNGNINDTSPYEPYEMDGTTNDAWDHLYATKKLDVIDIMASSPRYLWISGVVYSEYDDQDTSIESKQYYIITDNNNVYMCLKSGGISTTNPDIGGVTTAGVIDQSSTDGYIWKYMFTVPVDVASKFLTTSFIPVQQLSVEPDPDDDVALINQWSVQDNAIDGAIYNIKIVNMGAGYNTAPTVTIEGNGTGCEAIAELDSNNNLTNIKVTNPGSGYNNAVITLTGGGGSGAICRAVIGPKGGYGKDPRNDLRSHYISINKVFNGDENGDIPSTNDFRQISLIKNPIDTSTSAVAESNVYNTTKSLEVALGGSYPVDSIVVGTESNAKGLIVEYDGTNGIIYYVQNAVTGYNEFSINDLARLSTETTGGQDVTAVNNSEIETYSGDIIFMENRTPVSRGTDQIETIRLVIAF